MIKIVSRLFQRMTHGRHYRNPVITEARIAKVRMETRIAFLRRQVQLVKERVW